MATLNKDISIIRGDTYNYLFTIKTKEGYFTPQNGDKIYFTVKNTDNTNTVMFQLKFPDNITFDDVTKSFSMKINYTETDTLDFDTYIYDLELVTIDSIKKTLMYGNLKVLKEVTFTVNEV